VISVSSLSAPATVPVLACRDQSLRVAAAKSASYAGQVIAASSLAFLQAVRPAVSGGEGWKQAGELGLALVLSAAIGLEREIQQKHAGLRTHTPWSGSAQPCSC
jgi:hypothetical protein